MLKEFKKAEKLMGNAFEITIVTEDRRMAEDCIRNAIVEIKRIEKLMTTFSNDSQTSKVNSYAGIQPVKVDQEFFDLVERSIRVSQITDGAFDITYGSVDKKLWNFDRTMAKLPDAETARSMVKLINFRNVLLDKQKCSIFLKERGMRIGFGGIGKGYAAEQARKILKSLGITSGLVNASGDISAWGNQPNGEPWTIGIANPDYAHLPFSYLNISDMAVATSGNYEKYVIINDKKYSHTIDPKTGLPVTGIKSVTIISPNAELADAMATPVTIMGVKAGLDMINQIRQMECIIIDDNNKIFTSRNINLI